jgi:hypothetical protein
MVSGKVRAAHAKSMKFTDGFMIHSGQPARDVVDYAVHHVLLKQGVLGIEVKVFVRSVYFHPDLTLLLGMKSYDLEGQTGPQKPLPDTVTIIEPPLDKIVSEPSSESRGAPKAQIVLPAPLAASSRVCRSFASSMSLQPAAAVQMRLDAYHAYLCVLDLLCASSPACPPAHSLESPSFIWLANFYRYGVHYALLMKAI